MIKVLFANNDPLKKLFLIENKAKPPFIKTMAHLQNKEIIFFPPEARSNPTHSNDRTKLKKKSCLLNHQSVWSIDYLNKYIVMTIINRKF